MAQRIQRPSSAPPPNNGAPGPPSGLGGQVDDARKAVISILEVTHSLVQDTHWPKEASNDVQDLIREMEAPLALDKLPKEVTEVPEELKTEIHHLLGHLESAQARLKGESKKYGPKKKGLRKRVKMLFSPKDPTQCKEVNLSDRLKAENEQRLSRAVGDDSKGPLDTHATQTASTSNPQVNAQNDVTATSVPSNSPQDQSPPHLNQVYSSKAGEQKGSSTRGEWLNSANQAFRLAEGVSGALPVVGSYVGAVAKVGITAFEMVQVSRSGLCRLCLRSLTSDVKAMEGNDETAERLGNHVWRLSNLLERVSKHSQGSEKTQIIDGVNELQQELQSVQQQIKELQARGSLKKVWSSGDNAGTLKNLQEQVRAALEGGISNTLSRTYTDTSHMCLVCYRQPLSKC
ncbi:hypothetical protein FRC00_001365 [Tulasnella sp. 408]|nr:hypothetical protein FRC00_001365 [Tulasnella sp. 408]